ncbi:MAG: bifunctional oligoribonuclease/PAP phosphatase NrnA, partial [Eubacteriales bacterium]
NEILTAIRERNNFSVLTHINPDGDALGSLFALNAALRKMGKTSTALLLAPMPRKYVLEEINADFKLYDSTDKNYDCVISVDCADFNRLGEAKNLFAEKFSINIDHHSSNNGFGNISHIAMEAANGEIIYDLIEALGVPIDKSIAAALYIAVSSDTGNFTYENTTAKTFERCASLVAAGINVSRIANRLYNEKSLESTLLIGKVISNLRLYFGGQVAVTHISLAELQETGASAEDCETVINYARDIDTVEMAVFVRQMRERAYKVSFRSKEKVNVLEIAQQFSGGGHVRAAGCSINGELNDIMDTILSVAKEIFG